MGSEKDALKEIEKIVKANKDAQKDITSGWELAAQSITPLNDALASVSEAWKGWSAETASSAETLMAMSQTSGAVGGLLTDLGKGLESSGLAALSSIPGVTSFGAALNTASGILSLVATAINLVTMLFEAFGGSSSAASKKVEESTEALTSATDEMISTAADSNAAYLQTTGGIAAQADKARGLAAELEQLRNSTNGSVASQEQMQGITNQLVGMYPILAGNVNQYTGVLDGNISAIESVISAEEKMATLQSMKEREVELANESAEASANLYAMRAQQAQNNKIIADSEAELNALHEEENQLIIANGDANEAGTRSYKELMDALDKVRGEKSAAEQSNRDLTKSEEEAQEAIEAAKEAEELHAEAMKAATADTIAAYQERVDAGMAMTDTEIENMQSLMESGLILNEEQKKFAEDQITAMEDRLLAEADYIQQIKDGKVELAEADMEELERKKVLGEELSAVEQAKLDTWLESEQAAKEAAQQLYDERVAMTQNMFERINASEGQSLETLAGNLEHNQSLVDSWSKNLGVLADANIDAGLLQTLRDAGPEAAGTVQNMVDDLNNNSGAGLEKLNELWKNGSKVAIDSMKNEMGLPATTGMGADTINQIAQQTASNKAFQDAMKKQVADAKVAMDEQVKASNFKSIGEAMLNEIANGIGPKLAQISESLPKIKIKVDSNIALPHFSISGKFDAKTGSVPRVYISDWYDKGGYFNSPQLIGIAEKRPEFVGAAEDLESFISKSVNNAFVRIDPSLLYDIGGVGGGSAYGAETINFNPRVVINTQKLTDAEMRRATDYVSREFAKTVTGRKVGRLQ